MKGQAYPAIAAFVRGYLHQDALPEYGSAHAAAHQFCRDADSQQVEVLRREWRQFRRQNATLPEINRSLDRLGSAWEFQSIDEFERMLEAILRPRSATGGER